jgi:hypothetical protein
MQLLLMLYQLLPTLLLLTLLLLLPLLNSGSGCVPGPGTNT